MNQGGVHRDEERIFGEALRQSPAERGAFLAGLAGADATLIGRVEDLLREHDQSVNALDCSPGGELLAAGGRLSGEQLASNAGLYQLRQRLGEGGGGSVYLAEQFQPVRRSVAIKILKLGMDTRSVVARFQAERQALALMEHENIARVFDAGETAQGRPFFAMELVHGTRITAYCDEHRLTLRERLELFLRVCHAVQHAHQKGVIHRDLKPSNILVAGTGSAAQPKIIDFGVAKATQGRLADNTIVTEVDTFIGTPAYMSPEQADRRIDAIDTRTDIYSLGVVLYELLCGCTPLATADIRQVGIDEIRRQIREIEPLRPSARVRVFDDAARCHAAERRGLGAPKLGDALTADLDSVVMKCLEKVPGRRYESAGALGQDIGRCLSYEPVAARPAGQWYVWGKFVRRHRMAFAMAATVVLLLMAGATLSTVLLFREKVALQRAESATRQAKTEATRSARATEFMTSVLNGVKPAVARGRDKELLRELLDEAATRLDSVLQDEPAVEADLRDVIGEAFWHLDEPAKAARMHRRALALHEHTLGEMHPKVGTTLIRLGLFEMYDGDGVEAEKIFRRAFDLRFRTLGAEDPRTLDAMFFLADTLRRQKRISEATELLGQVRVIQVRIFPPDDLRLLRTEFILSGLLRRDGSLTVAERMMRAIIEKYPTDGRGQALSFFQDQALDSLGLWLMEEGRIDEAIEIFQRGLTSAVAQGHPNIGTEMHLARALHLRGRCDEALAALSVTIENVRQTVSRDDSRRFIRSLAYATMLRGGCLAHTGRAAEAEPVLREACSLSFRPESGIVHPAFDLAKVLRELGRPAEVDAALESALAAASRDGSEFVFQLLPPVHRARRAAPDANRAEALIREQLDSEAAWLERHGPVESAPYSLAVLFAAIDAGAAHFVAPVVQARLAWWEQHRPTGAPVHAYRTVFGEVMLAAGRLDEAERALLAASEGFARTKHHWSFDPLWRAGHLSGALARFYAVCNRPEEPGRWRQLISGGNFDPEWELSLAQVLFDAGRYREAGEILPGARMRLEERLVRQPDRDQLRSAATQATALAANCLIKLGRPGETEPSPREK